MTIETKFDTGDEIFYLMDGKIHSDEVEQINITKYVSNKPNIQYTVTRWIQSGSYPKSSKEFIREDEAFKSKEELIASL